MRTKFNYKSVVWALPFFLWLALPGITEAAPAQLRDIIVTLTVIVSTTARIIGVLLIIAFMWGIARFILNIGGSEKRATDKIYLIWVTLAMFVMFSVVGLVTLLQNTLLQQ